MTDLLQAVHAARMAALDSAAKAMLADARDSHGGVLSLRVVVKREHGDDSCEVEMIDRHGQPIGGWAL